MTCKTPGCANRPVPQRRICADCRNRRAAESSKRRYAARPRAERAKKEYGPCVPACPGWTDCTSRRPSDARLLPCEVLLPDEVDKEYDEGGPSYWVIPLSVTVNVGAMG